MHLWLGTEYWCFDQSLSHKLSICMKCYPCQKQCSALFLFALVCSHCHYRYTLQTTILAVLRSQTVKQISVKAQLSDYPLNVITQNVNSRPTCMCSKNYVTTVCSIYMYGSVCCISAAITWWLPRVSLSNNFLCEFRTIRIISAAGLGIVLSPMCCAGSAGRHHYPHIYATKGFLIQKKPNSRL